MRALVSVSVAVSVSVSVSVAVSVLVLATSAVLAAPRQLTLDERVACRLAVEQVYARHRLALTPGTAPRPIDEVALRDRVVRELKLLAAVEARRDVAVGAADLQREMDRIARSTGKPDLVREVFAALGADPYLVAECYARPTLVERLSTRDDLYAQVDPAAPSPIDDEQLVLRPVTAAHCRPGSWTPLTDVPAARRDHAAVWTGTEMIVWGGTSDGLHWFRDGSRYDPATDTWTWIEPPDASVPLPGLPFNIDMRSRAVWTGSEVVVWGDSEGGGQGVAARYEPATGHWRAVPQPASPSLGYRSVGVWSGTEFLVWDGGTGGRYDPRTDLWRPMAPGASFFTDQALTVWTGSEMIALEFGSERVLAHHYDPPLDAWSVSPSPDSLGFRAAASAVWTGLQVVVAIDGTPVTVARYAPDTGAWDLPLPDFPPPWPGPGPLQSAVSTGTEMLVAYLGIHLQAYDLATGTWRTSDAVDTGNEVAGFSAVWTGQELVVWGGDDMAGEVTDLGLAYDPASDTARPTFVDPVTERRPNVEQTGVSTGPETIVWESFSDSSSWEEIWRAPRGFLHDRATGIWRRMSVPAEAPSLDRCDGTSAVWTGTEMFVWGGRRLYGPYGPTQEPCGDGARYDPATDTWRPVSDASPLTPRWQVGLAWTGSEVFAWGGKTCIADYCQRPRLTGGGALYDPAADTWRALPESEDSPGIGPPTATLWTGSEILVWGGSPSRPGGGSRFDPATGTWARIAETDETSNIDQPGSRAVWTRAGMVVWAPKSSWCGGVYEPAADGWSFMATCPRDNSIPTLVSGGDRALAWGVQSADEFDPATSAWTPFAAERFAPQGRNGHVAHWDGEAMVVWGGWYAQPWYLRRWNDGAAYCPATAGAEPPVADAGPDQVLECVAEGQATAHLDGSASTPADLAAWDWSEAGSALGSGALLDVPFPLGAHDVTLRVTDAQGATDDDGVLITVADTLPPAGGITAPVAGACFGPGALPVVVADDFADGCQADVARGYVPEGGPAYSAHGDHAVTVTATDPSGNAASGEARFTIDTAPPEVVITARPDQLVFPHSGTFADLFSSSDDDGAAGEVVGEIVELDGCVIFDGATYGDWDGLLHDETLVLDLAALCRIAAACGRREWDDPLLTVRASDCGGNEGRASARMTGHVRLPVTRCAGRERVRAPGRGSAPGTAPGTVPPSVVGAAPGRGRDAM